MPAGRPKEHSNPTHIPLYLDNKDLEFIDDHRGTLSRPKYLIECMYMSKGDVSIYEKVCSERDIAKREIQELKRQILFEQSRNKKHTIVTETNEPEIIKFYTEKNIDKLITNEASKIDWEHFYSVNISKLSPIISDYKKFQSWCMDYYRTHHGGI